MDTKTSIHLDASKRIKQEYFCSIEFVMDCLAGKWKPSIVHFLKDGPVRFTELNRMIPKASRKVLAAQLRELEDDGLVERTPLEDEIPKGMEYKLSEHARALTPILQQLHAWGVNHSEHLGVRLELVQPEFC